MRIGVPGGITMHDSGWPSLFKKDSDATTGYYSAMSRPPPPDRAAHMRHVLVPLCLLPVLWYLSGFTAFRTQVSASSHGGWISLTVNGKTIAARTAITRVSKIEIRTINSVFPMGGETLRVDQNGQLLFEEHLPRRFSIPTASHAPLGDWALDPSAGSGTVFERKVSLTRDFTLRTTFTGRCTEFTSIILHGEPQVDLQFRRGFINNDLFISADGRVLANDALISPLSQMTLNALDILVRALIAACILMLIFFGIRRFLSLERGPAIWSPLRRLFRIRRFSSLERGPAIWSPLRRMGPILKQRWLALSLGVIVLVALGIRLWVAKGVLEGLAHTPDEVSYLLQAKWLVANELYHKISPIQEHLPVTFTYVRDGKWFGKYPIGWPLLLAAGQAVNLPWVVSPICGALYVLVIFLIGKELYGKLVGLAAALLSALSPMAVLMFSSYLSHGSAALMIALFVWLLLVGIRRQNIWYLSFSGVCLGFAFSIRPLTALAIACPFGAWFLWRLLKESRQTARQVGAIVVGGVIGALPVFICNHFVTGRAFSFAYSYGAGEEFSPQSFPSALMYLDATLASVPPAIFGWGWGAVSGWPILSLSLAFAILPFLLRRPGTFEKLFAAAFLVLPLSFLMWNYHGLHGYGPRFYFEVFLSIFLLTALGFALLAGVDPALQPVRLQWGPNVAKLTLGMFLVLVLSTAVTLPFRMSLYRGYNGVSSALEKAISSQPIQRGLILLPDGTWFPWGEASNLLEADLHGRLAFAISRADDSKLLAFYSDRPLYTWQDNRLSAVSRRLGTVAAPVVATTANGPSVPGLTTLLGWWLALTVIGTGALLALSLLRRVWLRPRLDHKMGPVFDGEPPVAPSLGSSEVQSQTLSFSRACVGIVAIVTAYVGQMLLGSQGLHIGWILLVVGGTLFGLAWRSYYPQEVWFSAPRGGAPILGAAPGKDIASVPDKPQNGLARPDNRLEPATGESHEHSPGERARRILRLAAIGIYLCNSIAWFWRGESVLTRWLWFVSLIVFILSLFRLPLIRIGSTKRNDDLPWLPATLLLGLITAVAFWLRFVNLVNVPRDVHGDFASVGLSARELLAGRVPAIFSVGWTEMPWPAFLPTAISMRIFGDNLFGLRMAGVIAGTVTVVGIYYLASLLFTRSVGLLAATVSSLGYTDIHFSRVGVYIDPVPWMVFGLYFLLRGLRSGRSSHFAFSGVLLAIGFEMYYSGRLIVFVLLGLLLYLALFHARLLRSRGKKLLLLVAAGLLSTGPLLFYYLRNYSQFMQRTKAVYIFNPDNMRHLLSKYNANAPAQVLAEQIRRSLLTFNYLGDSSTQFGFYHPMLNPLLAPMLILGIGFSLWRFRRFSHAVLLLWLVVGVVIGSILTIDAPFWPRVVVILPAVAILTGLGLHAAFETLRTLLLRSQARPWLTMLPAAGMLVWAGHQNWQWYFHGGIGTSVAPIAWVGRLIEESPQGTAFCMIRGPLNFADRVPQFLGKGHTMLDFPPERLSEFLPRCLADGRIWVIIRPDHDQLLALLNLQWPDARQEQHNYSSGQPGPIFWYPPPRAKLTGQMAIPSRP